MGINDELMDEMIASEKSIVDTGGQKIDLFKNKPLVPRVDKYVGTKRAGMGPDNLPIFRNDGDAEMFLEAAGFVSPTAEMIRGAKMMTEGDLMYGAGTIGFGAIGGGIIKGILKGSKTAIQSVGKMFSKKPQVLEDIYGGVSTTTEQGAKLASDAASKAELSRRLEKGTRTMDRDHVEGLIQAENMRFARAKARGDKMVEGKPAEIAINKIKGEFRKAAFKAEEYIQRNRNKVPLEPFLKQAGGNHQMAEDIRGAWLLQEAVEKKVLTPKQANLYRGSGFPSLSYYEVHPAVAGKFRSRKAASEIKEQVRQSLHAEDLSKAGLGVEITPKGPRATAATHPIDLLPK